MASYNEHRLICKVFPTVLHAKRDFRSMSMDVLLCSYPVHVDAASVATQNYVT